MPDKWKSVDEEHRSEFTATAGRVAQGGYQPILCPVCHGANLRHYWRQYRVYTEPGGRQVRMGSNWTWCPHCHSFFHAVGYLPDWWPLKDPIPDVKPLYLDRVSVDEYWGTILNAISS